MALAAVRGLFHGSPRGCRLAAGRSVGTKVEFNYGAMCGTEDGLIVDFGGDRWHDFYLIAETADGEEKKVHGQTHIGIGTYFMNGETVSNSRGFGPSLTTIYIEGPNVDHI